MSADSYNHAICDRCWAKREPGRQPVRVSFRRPDERCCYCGGPAQGIYVREDPKQVHKDAGVEQR